MSENLPLRDTTVLVTGASAGIGKESAIGLAREGASVTLAARRESKLEDVASKIENEQGGESYIVPTDVRDPAQVDELIAQTIDEYGSIDTVVSNAGITYYKDIESLTINEFKEMIEVNVDGSFYITQSSLPHLKESNGKLIYVSSWGSKYPRPHVPVYAGTKYWIRGFALSLSGMVSAEGVSVTVINPGSTRTELGQDTESKKQRIPEGAALEPEVIANSVVFAAKQKHPVTVGELDVHMNDRYQNF